MTVALFASPPTRQFDGSSVILLTEVLLSKVTCGVTFVSEAGPQSLTIQSYNSTKSDAAAFVVVSDSKRLFR